jgi:hypothetical protein
MVVSGIGNMLAEATLSILPFGAAEPDAVLTGRLLPNATRLDAGNDHSEPTKWGKAITGTSVTKPYMNDFLSTFFRTRHIFSAAIFAGGVAC